MAKKYKVITLCGSTKFKDEFIKAENELTLKGNVVLSCVFLSHNSDCDIWQNMMEEQQEKIKAMLDEIHKRKIDMADEIFVLWNRPGDSAVFLLCGIQKTGKRGSCIKDAYGVFQRLLSGGPDVCFCQVLFKASG